MVATGAQENPIPKYFPQNSPKECFFLYQWENQEYWNNADETVIAWIARDRAEGSDHTFSNELK
ncbi:hypothetical protein [Lusitaniella coriacea]|uniref:hypothetical protein n=1 Tax=Lusitaniella coriacea TaxID=1983105 RepID=UPI003CEDB1CB